jgi:polar amino acid transport system permease protein
MRDAGIVLQYWSFLGAGLLLTIELSLLGMLGGTVIGLLAAVARVSGNRFLSALVIGYVDVFRSVPILVQLIWIYYALPAISNLSLSPMWAAAIVLSLYSGSAHAETFRAGIISIGGGQEDAAKALGMTRPSALARIILPQAIIRVLPAYASILITLIKDSALASAVSVPELLHQGATVASYTLRPFAALSIVALIYFAVTYPLSSLVNLLHRRLRT